jgi:SAM-dependent methyltransferase
VSGGLLSSPAAERNKEPILTVLESVVPAAGNVLEIASGTGQHVCFFADRLPQVSFQPTEPEAASRDNMRARIRAARLVNVQAPIALDVHQTPWPLSASFDVILCINMIHISPWTATEALCRGAAQHLRPQGKLLLYGPYLEDGTAAQSNLDFDASLKRRNAEWGLRDLDSVTRVAAAHGLQRQEIVRMPANNLALVFAKSTT